MKRKIIPQPNGSVKVTLPIEWVRERNLDKKDELDIVKSGDYLIIGTKKIPKRSISLSIVGIDEGVKKLVASLYRNGYDEINLKFDKAKVGNHISELAWQLVGFEIEKLSNTNYRIRDIAELNPESFDTLFKKCFIVLLHFKNEIIHYLEQKDWKSLSATLKHDDEINKLTNLCQRLLSKKMNDRRKIATLAIMLKCIEKIADEFKCIVEYSVKNKDANIKEIKETGERINKLYHLYYRPDLSKLLQLNQELRGLKLQKEGVGMFLHTINKLMTSLIEGPIVIQTTSDEMQMGDWIG